MRRSGQNCSVDVEFTERDESDSKSEIFGASNFGDRLE